jgi:DegV family protein with EDD domain
VWIDSGLIVVKIVTESTADIPAEMAAKLDITIVPSYVIFGMESYGNGVELTKGQFYKRLATTHEIPKTATPPPAIYEQAYRRLAQETDEIVSIHLAANLSGLYNTAMLAAERVSEIQIAIIDSQQVSMGYGWMVIAAAQAAQQGEPLEKIVSLVERMKNRSYLLAVLDTLEFVYRGGRVSWVEAMVGTLMQIKPIVQVYQGQVELLERARTRTRSLNRLMDLIQSLGPLERAIVLHANAAHYAEQLATRLQILIPDWERLVDQAGVTVASHTGPGAVGIACVTVN